MSTISLSLFRSCKQYSIIFLSDSMPSARITINRGTGLRTFGIVTTIWLFVNVVVGDTIFTAMVLAGFDESSDTVLISAE